MKNYELYLNELISCYKWPSKGTMVVAISGGPDSTCAMRVMYDIAKSKGFKLHLAHLDHCLRGEESDKDADYVKELANEFNCDYTVEKANIKEIYNSARGSMQQVCRDVRQAFLKKIIKRVSAFGITYGHNKGDQAETILQHLIRGSGLIGLTGMKVLDVNYEKFVVFRPILKKTRPEILEMLNYFQLTYRQDASNETDKYQRNHIRHNLIPFIEKHYNPQIVDRLTDMSTVLLQDEVYLQKQANIVAQRAISEDHNSTIVDCIELQDEDPAIIVRVMRYAYRVLTGNTENLTFEHSMRLGRMINDKHGVSLSLPQNVTCEKVYDRLYLYYKGKYNEKSDFHMQISNLDQIIELPQGKKLSVEFSDNEVLPGNDNFTDYCKFDLEKISLPLTVRTRKNGDRFFPSNSPGKKKLKDFFIDKKIPKKQRDDYVLIVDNSGKILWVVGLRRSQYARITDKTKKTLALRIMEGE